MNEKKKLYIIIIVFVGLLSLLIIGLNYGDKKGTVNIDALKDVFASDKMEAVYIGRADCSYCVMFEPQLKYLAKEYGFEYTYIDTNQTSQSDLTEILGELGIDPNNFGTPHVTFVKNGKVKDQIGGYINEEPLFDKFKENGMIDANAVYKENENADEDAEVHYIQVSANELLEIHNSGEDYVFVIGSTTCIYCTEYKPIISDVAKDKGVAIYYMDYNMQTAEDLEKVRAEIDFFEKVTDWGTPVTVFMRDKTYLDSIGGKRPYEDVVKIFKKLEFIK